MHWKLQFQWDNLGDEWISEIRRPNLFLLRIPIAFIGMFLKINEYEVSKCKDIRWMDETLSSSEKPNTSYDVYGLLPWIFIDCGEKRI